MTGIRYATETRASYENFYARCPWCKAKNVFNRESDLGDVHPIAYKEVRCLNGSCGKPFEIKADSVNSAYEMIIYDCYELKREKKYCYCILNLAQAFEVFFSLYLRVHLLYHPFVRYKLEAQDGDNLKRFNALASLLYRTVKDYGFAKMRNIFLNRMLSNQNIHSFDQAESIIRTLPTCHQMPSDQSINACTNLNSSILFKRVL